MSFPFQMNIDNNFLKNDMDLDDDVLFNFTDATSQLIRDNNIPPYRGPQEKASIVILSCD